jgi:lipopolysaccharide export system permease protein
MRIIDRYIIKKLLTTFAFVVLIIIAVVMVIDLTEKLDKFTKYELSTMEVLSYYGDFLPFIASLITPITTFIATVFVTAKLASHSEIIAILCGGTSFKRFMVPYIIGSSIIALTSFIFNGWIIPNSNKDRIAFEVKYIRSKFYFDERNFHIQVEPNKYLYMESYNNNSNIGNRFTLEELEGTKLKQKLSARRIEWDEENQKWILFNWMIRKINEDGEEIYLGVRKDTTLIIHPREFESDYRMYEGMTLPELKRYITELEARGSEGKEFYVVERLIRFTAPFSIIILTIIGVIVSARKARGGTGFQIALGFTLSFVYIIFFMMARSIAEVNALPPLLAVWIPNITFGLVGLILYRTVPR